MNRVAAATVILGVAVASGVTYRLLKPPVTLLTEVPPAILIRQPELEPAYRQYIQNGGKYIWGDNDCSIFASSYINQCGTTCPYRPTTKELMDPQFMAQVGFAPANGQAKTGDVIVFRYLNQDKEWRGHTGVVVWHQDAKWVMHNTERYKGLVVESLDRFMDRAKSATKGEPGLTRIFRRRDFETWYSSFCKRRDANL